MLQLFNLVATTNTLAGLLQQVCELGEEQPGDALIKSDLTLSHYSRFWCWEPWLALAAPSFSSSSSHSAFAGSVENFVTFGIDLDTSFKPISSSFSFSCCRCSCCILYFFPRLLIRTCRPLVDARKNITSDIQPIRSLQPGSPPLADFSLFLNSHIFGPDLPGFT